MRHRPTSLAGLAAAIALLAAAPARPSGPQTQAKDAFAARRANLAAQLDKGFALVPAQTSSARGPADNPNFYYLTGATDLEAVLLVPGDPGAAAALFNRSGRLSGPGRPEGLDVKPLAEARGFVAKAAAGRKGWLPFPGLESVLSLAGGSAALAQAEELRDVEPVLAAMRIVKSPEEIAIIARAIAATSEAYVEMLKAAGPGMSEVDLRAVLDYVYSRRGATSSFTQVASGPNSVNIHFGATPRVMRAGDTVVFDLGAWVDRYTSDISRMMPVGGRFSPAQAEIHRVVLDAELEGISLMTAGRGVLETQTAVEDALLRGLQRLGLVTDPASPWQRRLYIQHGFIHGIGLEVHDVWSWFARQMRRGYRFLPGMVLTMEPGLYFPAGRLDAVPAELKALVPEAEWAAFAAKAGPVYKRYENVGCRIEDDVLVLESGNKVLTAAAPKTIAEIEKTMRLPSPFKPER